MSDIWLEGPYIDAAEAGELHEQFQQSPDYAEAFDDWLHEHFYGDDQ